MSKNSAHLSSTPYQSLPLEDALQSSIKAAGFEQCTPIQEATIPVTLEGRDVAGQAQTGTGKSAAFLISTFQHLLTKPAQENRKPNQVRALMLAPTRELAIQIHKDALALASKLDLSISVVFGGANYNQQKEEVENGADILIGTPGRLIDFWKQKVFDLSLCDVVVLDEADRMFDLGFIADVRFLLRRCPEPKQRLSMLFSATLSHRVQELAYEHMNTPQLIKIEAKQVTGDRIEQILYHPANDEKIPLLFGMFVEHAPERSVVFVNTKRNADLVWAYLEGNGIAAGRLSGDVPQNKRTHMLEKFQTGELSILVATDVAARGLHIDGVTHVFNFDLPQSGEDYVHRIGRTARAGASGVAISFACEDTAFYLMDIEAYTGKALPNGTITPNLLMDIDPPVKIERPPQQRRSSGGRTNNRNGQNTRRRRPPQR